jgi:hypothetical protein
MFTPGMCTGFGWCIVTLDAEAQNALPPCGRSKLNPATNDPPLGVRTLIGPNVPTPRRSIS